MRHVVTKREDLRMFDLDGEARERLIVWIRRRMDEFGITLEELEASSAADAQKAPMYRDAYGNTWDGQGERPEWLTRAVNAGQNMEHFRC
ncbi:H-NS family nucleoid-associated regulatory protein [Paraburkholderia kururiensis]